MPSCFCKKITTDTHGSTRMRKRHLCPSVFIRGEIFILSGRRYRRHEQRLKNTNVQRQDESLAPNDSVKFPTFLVHVLGAACASVKKPHLCRWDDRRKRGMQIASSLIPARCEFFSKEMES